MEEIYRAKEIIDNFLEIQIEDLVSILGRDHPYDLGENETVGDIEEAYNTISEWFRER